GDTAHADIAHGDTAHGDIAHGDIAHGDTARDYMRPEGVLGSFDEPPAAPDYAPPPPTVSPEQRAAFSRPPGAAEFAPPPGERLPPRHGVLDAAVPPGSIER